MNKKDFRVCVWEYGMEGKTILPNVTGQKKHGKIYDKRIKWMLAQNQAR